MSDPDAAVHNEERWPTQGFRARLGSRLERHVMRSAVDMLDERGTELDGIDRDLQRRERDLQHRFEHAETREGELEHRERRLSELDAGDLAGQPRIDHLIRQLDRTEAALGQARAEARNEVAAAHDETQRLKARVRELEEEEHRHLINQADLTRRESTVSSQERELRDQDEALRRRELELEARQAGLLAHERRLAERERRVDAAETDARTRMRSLERRERELEEREEGLRRRDGGWWTAADD
jgi:DNA repair exonuclease SbcCD ATPase subunit